MAEKFQNKYRIPSTRLQNWNYGLAGAHFITICTANREYFFDKINNGILQLSNVGVIANVLWYEIKNHTTNVELGTFIVMPNHVHGILVLNGNNNNTDTTVVETTHALSL